jgi:hypothetical protein
MSGAVVVSLISGVINLGFGGLLLTELLPPLLGEAMNIYIFLLSVVSALLLLAGGWMIYSSPWSKRTGGWIVIVGAIIGALNPLSLIFGLLGAWGALQEASRTG